MAGRWAGAVTAVSGDSHEPAGVVPAPTVSAGLGEANMVGGLSVPSNWTVAAPEIRSVAMTSPLTNAAAAAAARWSRLGKHVQPDGAWGYGRAKPWPARRLLTPARTAASR